MVNDTIHLRVEVHYETESPSFMNSAYIVLQQKIGRQSSRGTHLRTERRNPVDTMLCSLYFSWWVRAICNWFYVILETAHSRLVCL